MKFSFNRKLKSLLLSKSRRSIWHRIVLAVACLVVGVTSYALILPALTMNGEYLCGLEAHTHGAACYALNEQGETVLICDKTEHQHDERCLVTQEAENPFICGYAYEHTHEDGCYCDGVLVCTLVEHVHESGCYKPGYTASAEKPEEETVHTITPTKALLLKELGQLEGVTLLDENGNPYELPESGENAQKPDATGETASTESAPSDPAATAEPLNTEEGEAETQGEASDAESPSEEVSVEELKEALLLERDGDRLLNLRRAVALEEGQMALYNALGSDRPDGVPQFTDDETDTYVPLDSDGTVVTVEYWKGSVQVTDLSLMLGDNYQLKFHAENPYIITVLQSYTQSGVVYYYKLSCPNCNLFSVENGEPLESYFADWRTFSNHDQLRVIRESGTGDYWLAFRNISDDDITDMIDMGLALRTRETPTPRSISKSYAWETSNYAYRYTVTGLIPRIIDNYTQFYYLHDSCVIGDTYYNAFSAGDNLDSLVVKLNGTEIKPIDQVYNDENAQFAYYMNSEGDIYILNRTPHSGAHEAIVPESVAGVVDQYPGWCFCWGQKQDMNFEVSYLDTNAQLYYTQTGAEKIVNTAFLYDKNKDEPVFYQTETTNPQRLLVKVYDSSSKTFTVVFNGEYLDLSDRTYQIEVETLIDVMINGLLLDNEDVTVTRYSEGHVPNPTPDGLLVEGTDYNFSRVTEADGTSRKFTIGLEKEALGPYCYEISYKVRLPEGTTSLEIDNSVGVAGTGISKKISVNYDESSYYADSRVIKFVFELDKVYERGNPDKGAKFGVYQASNDRLIFVSAVEETNDGLVRQYRNARNNNPLEIPIDIQTPYTPGASLDPVYVASGGLLHANTLYYVQEMEAPESFDLNEKKYYFYATNYLNPDLRPVGLDALIAAGESVTAISDWQSIVDGNSIWHYAIGYCEDQCFNPKLRVKLPATGGFGAPVVYTAGTALVLAPLLWLMLRKHKGKGVGQNKV